MVSTRSGGGKKSPKSPLKSQPSKVKKDEKAAPKRQRPLKKKHNAKQSSPSMEKRVSFEETETEYSDENDDIVSPYVAVKHRSPTSYKAPKGSRRYSGNGKLVNNKGRYTGVAPKSSPGLGRKTSLGYGDEDDEDSTGFGDVGPAPATVHKNRSSPASPRMDMELKAAELLNDLMNLSVRFMKEGHQHRSFGMIAKHLSLPIEILLDMERYPGSWPEGLDEISVPTWRNKILDMLEHIQDNDPNSYKLEKHRDPLWPGVKALDERFGSTPWRVQVEPKPANERSTALVFEAKGFPEEYPDGSTSLYDSEPTAYGQGSPYRPHGSPYKPRSSSRKPRDPDVEPTVPFYATTPAYKYYFPKSAAPKSPNTRGASFSYDPPTPDWSLD